MYITENLICQGLSEQFPVLPKKAAFGLHFLINGSGIFNITQSNFKSLTLK